MAAEMTEHPQAAPSHHASNAHADDILRDYESKAPFWFRWIAALVESFFSLLFLASLLLRYVWCRMGQSKWFGLLGGERRANVSFRGETVLITGAGGYLGRALAIEFAREARTLALLDIQKKPLDDLKQDIMRTFGQHHCKVHVYRCDITDFAQLTYTMTTIKQELREINVLINCAGIGHFKDVLAHTEDDYKHSMNANVLAPILACKSVLPDMIQSNKGHIVNIVSSAALSGSPYGSSYGASKAALHNFTECLQQELILAKKTGVHVTSVLPFYLDGGIFNSLRKLGKENVLGATPIRFDCAARAIVRGLRVGDTAIYMPSMQLRSTILLKAILPDAVWQRFLIHILGRDRFVAQHRQQQPQPRDKQYHQDTYSQQSSTPTYN